MEKLKTLPKRVKDLKHLLNELEEWAKNPEDYDEVNYKLLSGTIAEISEMPGTCGMHVVHDLEDRTPKLEQVVCLLEAFGFEPLDDHRIAIGQVLLTDAMGSENNRWTATKKKAYKGPITINPNTGNKIRTYIVTKDMLVKIYNSR